MRSRRDWIVAIVAVLALFTAPAEPASGTTSKPDKPVAVAAASAPAPPTKHAPRHGPAAPQVDEGSVVVRFKAGLTVAGAARIAAAHDGTLGPLVGATGFYSVGTKGKKAEAVLADLLADPGVAERCSSPAVIA